MRTRAPQPSERGAAVVEFALVGMIAIILFLGVAQLAVYLYQRNVLLGSLSEGARVAAAQGRTPAEGQQRAATLIREAAGRSATAHLTITAGEQGDLVVLQARGELRPGFLPVFPTVPVQMTASMHKEERLVGRVPR